MMYQALWNVIPGPRWARIAILTVSAAIVALSLFEWVFPWISSILPYQEQTVE